MNEASFAHDVWFEAKCFWCGIPAAVGEKVEIIEYSRREAYWMHPNCARLYVEALGNPKTFVALPPSVVDEYFKRIKRFPDGPSPLDLPSVDLLVVGIMARDDDEPGYAAAVARGIAVHLGDGCLEIPKRTAEPTTPEARTYRPAPARRRQAMEVRTMTGRETLDKIIRDYQQTIHTLTEQNSNPVDRAACIYGFNAAFVREFREAYPPMLPELMLRIASLTLIAINSPELLYDETAPVVGQ